MCTTKNSTPWIFLVFRPTLGKRSIVKKIARSKKIVHFLHFTFTPFLIQFFVMASAEWGNTSLTHSDSDPKLIHNIEGIIHLRRNYSERDPVGRMCPIIWEFMTTATLWETSLKSGARFMHCPLSWSKQIK